MGGKVKQSQRTKNNVRPSSSSRSAVLLSTESAFGALGSGLEKPTIFPALLSTDVDQNLSPEYLISFKKLTKKDPITKTKALQELAELVKTSNEDEAVAVLPSWAHHYQTLIYDADRRVREAAQVCHGALMVRCGRRVAPQLRRLLPSWMVAQHDLHAPAASLAHAQLTNTFPENKLSEALSFCKTEFVTLLIGNLTGSAEAILKKKVEDAEELAQQVSRVVCCSLRALELLVRRLARTHDDWLWTALAPLLANNQFWKLAAHASQNVRAAWYGAMGLFIERYAVRVPRALGERAARALVAQVERAADVAAQRWAAVLLLMRNVQDWHLWLDKKDLLIKRLFDVLENGCWGEARLLSNMLLPVLANLPSELLDKEFYMTFFNSIFTGLQNKNLQNSKIERQLWITNLAECLRYLSVQPYEFTTEVVTYVHRAWIDHVFAIKDKQARSNLIRHSATKMAEIIKFWLNHSKENDRYDQLVRNFWQNIGSTILAQVDKLSVEANDVTQLIDEHVLLLKTLNTSFIQEKKQLSIQFEDDKIDKIDMKPAENISCEKSLINRFKHNMNELIGKTCCHYFDFAHRKQVSQAVFASLLTLLTEFDSKDLFLAIARQFNLDSVYNLYDSILKPWVSGDTMRCQELVVIIFLLVKYLTEDEQDRMFNSFQQFPPLVTEWCLAVCLSHPHNAGDAARRWLRGGVVAASVVALCRHQRARPMLLMCLAHDCTGEVMINESAVIKMIEIVSEDVDRESDKVESATTFASQLVGALTDTSLQKHTPPLLTKLFNLNMYVLKGSSVMSWSAWEEARSCWRDALPADAQLLDTFLHTIHKFVFDNIEELDMKRIEHVAFLCPYLFISTTTNKHKDVQQMASLAKRLFAIPSKQPAVPLEMYATRCDCIFGNINCPFGDENQFVRRVVKEATRDYEELNKSDLLLFVKNLLYKAFVLRAIMGKSEALAEEDGVDVVAWGDELIKDEYFEDMLSQLFHDFAVLRSLHKRYAFWPNFAIIDECSVRMEALLSDIVSVLSTESRGALAAHLAELSAARGFYWPYALQILHNMNKRAETPQRVTDLSETTQPKEQTLVDMLNETDLEKLNGDGFFHSLQAEEECFVERSLYVKYVLLVRSLLAAHSAEPDVAHTLLQGVEATQCIDAVVSLYYKYNHVMLYESDLGSAAWGQVVSNAATVEYLALLVRAQGWQLSATQWDFTTITLCSLVTAIRNTRHWELTQVAIMTTAVIQLFTSVQQFVASIRKEAERRQPSDAVLALLTEWKDIFAPDINKNIFELISIVLRSASQSMTLSRLATISSLVEATHCLEWEAVPAPLRAEALALAQLARLALRVLQDNVHRAYHHLAYALLRCIQKPLVLDDAEKLAQWSAKDDEENQSRPEFSLEYYFEALRNQQELMDAALSNVQACLGTCEMVPGSDSERVSLGYMLLAAALLLHCQLARKNLHLYYVELFREDSYASWLLHHALRLLPAEALSGAAHSAALLAAFDSLPTLDLYKRSQAGAGEVSEVGAVACWVAAETLGGAGGAEARDWASALEVSSRRAGVALRQLVRAAVTPVLVRRQLTQLRDRAHEIENTKVSIHWSRSEAVLVLEVDEQHVELTVQYSDTHPLAPPRVLAPPTAPLPNTAWLVLYLTYQNGTLLNVGKMWSRAVTRRVEASPQCYVCYCRMHPTGGRLPSVPCHQCHNHYHTACLRKWFVKSKQSICPLCRAKF